jgi:spore coat protein U-like protein
MIWGSSASGHPPEPIIVPPFSGTSSGPAVIYGRVFGGQPTASPAVYETTFSDVTVLYSQTTNTTCADMSGSTAPSPTFTVQATIPKDCRVTPEPVSFGTRGVLDGDVDATGAVNVTCTADTDYAIRLDGGRAEAATPNARKMSKGDETITYGLYKSATRDDPWGDTEDTIIRGTGSGTNQLHTVYGRVPPQATPSPGTYTDTVVVTVDY